MTVATLSLQILVCALATYGVVGQVIKPGLRALARRRRSRGGTRLTPRESAAISWATRALALAVGALLGLVPAWHGEAAGPLVGLAAGCLCVPLHAAVVRALPAAVARALAGGDAQGEEEA